MKGIKAMFGRRFRAGSYAAFAALLVIAIAVAANILVSALPESMTQTDMTSQNLYTLSDQTKRIASSLDKDVTLYLLASDGNEDNKIERLLSRYQDLSSHIKVENVDPTERPTFLDSYDLSDQKLYQNSVLAVCGDRHRLVGYDEIYVTNYSMDYQTYSYTSTTDFDGENALTNAIHYVSRDDLPVIYTLTGHGETELSDTVADMVKRENLSTESLSLLSKDAVPENAGAVVINNPTGDISEDEANLLCTYLDNGGRIFLMTDYIAPGKMENLLKVTAKMGLGVDEGIIIEADQNMHLNRYPYYLLPTLEDHDILKPLSDGGYYVLVPLAQPLTEKTEAGADITWLLTTSDSAYSKKAALEMKTTDKEDGDTAGPFHVAAASELGDAKLVWVTSSELLTDNVNAMVSGANSDLFLNSLDWMNGESETISIRSKSLDASRLTVTASQNAFWSVVMVGLIPVLLIICGVVIAIRRKRR